MIYYAWYSVVDLEGRYSPPRLLSTIMRPEVFLKLIIRVMFQEFSRKPQEEDSSTMHALRVDIVEPDIHFSKYR